MQRATEVDHFVTGVILCLSVFLVLGVSSPTGDVAFA